MISMSRLLCGSPGPGDALRYPDRPGRDPRAPVVVWNATRRCNLSCAHCYADAAGADAAGELSGREARNLVRDLAAFGVPALLLSGGEPLLRPDILELAGIAAAAGVRPILSTNGTLVTAAVARRIRRSGIAYAGVSIDGRPARHDRFRGAAGSYDRALEGMRRLAGEGVRTGLRFTLARRTAEDLPHVFDLAGRVGASRVCIYHLAYTGRGRRLRREALDHGGTRRALEIIIDRTPALAARGVEVLTVDNHADGAYLLLRLERSDPRRAAAARDLLRRAGGNRSGTGIAAIDAGGDVLPDQFWRNRPLGNVRERPFADIWTDGSNRFLRRIRDRRPLLAGRCRRCRFLDICNGNLRARAEAAWGDPWADDPACYLTDAEIE
ncbi:MAG: radical SAM protein [bacterium]|nr:radical SAM protein [bacterium]